MVGAAGAVKGLIVFVIRGRVQDGGAVRGEQPLRRDCRAGQAGVRV